MAYARNFLDAVVLEIKFEDISLSKLDPFKEEFLTKYPNQKRSNSIEGFVDVDMKNGTVDQSRTEKVVWTLSDDAGSRHFSISQNAIVLEYDKRSYTNSAELLSDVDTVVGKFVRDFGVGIITRIGLRYANRIPTTYESEEADLSELINDKLLGAYTYVGGIEGISGIARSMTQQLIKYDNANLTFISGIWNNDFPNRIVNEEFILDYDCFMDLPVNASELNIVDLVRKFNGYIETLFEASILQKTREWMGISE